MKTHHKKKRSAALRAAALRRLRGKSQPKAADTSALECASHGRKPWLGDVVCASCGEIFLREDDPTGKTDGIYVTVPATGMCNCGVRLFPERDANGKMLPVEFSARPACPDCARPN
jgi:hypothetical protein